MHRPPRDHLSRATARLVAWCLLALLPLYGASSTLVGLLGPTHLHRAAASPMDGWHDFRRSSQVTESAPRGHAHGWFQRHHHALDDASVVALDAGGEAVSGEAAASAGAPLVAWVEPGDGLVSRPGTASSLTWPEMAPPPIRGRDIERLERPPRA